MSDYSELSYFEINKRVAEALGFDVVNEQINEVVGEMWVIKNGRGVRNGLPNYCSNPADAWPLILESGIGIKQNFSNDDWLASPRKYDDGHMMQIDENPLRAAMIVYLMMKEREHE